MSSDHDRLVPRPYAEDRWLVIAMCAIERESIRHETIERESIRHETIVRKTIRRESIDRDTIRHETIEHESNVRTSIVCESLGCVGAFTATRGRLERSSRSNAPASELAHGRVHA